jgi:hypothetical protein
MRSGRFRKVRDAAEKARLERLAKVEEAFRQWTESGKGRSYKRENIVKNPTNNGTPVSELSDDEDDFGGDSSGVQGCPYDSGI